MRARGFSLSGWALGAPVWRICALALGLSGTAPVEAAVITASTEPEVRAEPSDVTIPPETSPHVYQTLLASALMLGGGTVWYFLDQRNVLDWDYPSLKSRLNGSSWTYDNNNFWMNFNGHPLFGAGVYATARTSHLPVAYAAGATFATSILWEFVIEYNERVSINDVIVTPLSGVAMGEFAHKLGYYLSSFSRPSPGRSALSWSITPWNRLATLGCDGEPKRRLPQDSLGYDSGLWHDFTLAQSLSYLRRNGSDALDVYAFHGKGRLVSLPGYHSTGTSEGSFWNADISRLSLIIEGSREGSGVDLATDSVLLGYRAKSLGSEGGHERVFGVALGYRYEDSSARGQDDRRSWVGFPGVATDLYWEHRALSSEIQFRAYPLFGGVSSPAFQPYYKRNPDQTFKTVLSREGYFYGWGFASELAARQKLGILSSDLTLRAESIWSDEGLDRDQSLITDDVKARDLSVSMQYVATLSLPHSFVAGMIATAQQREALAGNVRMTLSQRSLGLWLGARF